MSPHLRYRVTAVALVTGTLWFQIPDRVSHIAQGVAMTMIHLGLVLLSLV